ncbi:MAG: glycosyltransferase [bacterium]|nr:glycosyltransferase [bacterium]
MIPKKIHYLWFGDNPKSDLAKKCINSWQQKLPNYELVEWNETNTRFDKNLENNRFVRECYNRKLWAFVADFFRCKILYEHGGIYFDTDIEVLKPFDNLLDKDLFIGYQNSSGSLNASVFASKAKHAFLKDLINFYNAEIWDVNFFTIPDVLNYIYYKYKGSDKITIYPKEYFYPYFYDEEFSPDCLTLDTYTIHWWSRDWGDKKSEAFLKKKHLKSIRKYVNYFFHKVRI